MKTIIQICTAMYLHYFVLSYRHYGFNNSPVRFSTRMFPSSKDFLDTGKRKPTKGANELFNSYYKIGLFAVPYGGTLPDLKTRALPQAQSQVPKLRTSKPAMSVEKIRLVEKSSAPLIVRGKSQPAKPVNVRLKPVKRPVVVIGPMHGPLDHNSEGWALAAVLRLAVDPWDKP